MAYLSQGSQYSQVSQSKLLACPWQGTTRDASETEITSAPADPDQPTCALSGERFDSFWDDATNEWRFQGAVALTEDQAARWEIALG